MKKRIFTGNYTDCKYGNLISISGDRGKRVGFIGKSIPKLAPKRAFWEVWHNNIGKIPEEDNMRYYIEEYYKQVLCKVNIEELLKNEKDPILLCYEKSNEFCHRHIVAEYINLVYDISVADIEIDEKLQIKINERPKLIRKLLEETIQRQMDKESR